ncbi:PAAR domain-containing protein [Massilia consociata]|uniref:PAAR domain-containing protein n=1 Tax=Massilia consociata TaxID=760117 RepID=A0ABV6FJI9_9BURK
MPEIIRMGDSTSHGGKVIEGSPFDICMGKPIAYMGHKVQCPKCKGVFPIVEGALTTTFYGKGVALAGMKTACGAVLIASQFTDVVEYGGGGSAARGAAQRKSETAVTPMIATSNQDSSEASSTAPQFDDRFILQDAETGRPIAHTEYAIRRASGEIEHGVSDAEGRTHLLSATATAEQIEIFV